MSNQYLAFLDQKADQYGVPRPIARAMVQQESGWNPNAVSPAGAMGMMQLMPGTARDLGVRNPMDPYENIDGGLRYYANLASKYGYDGGLAAYNGGPGNWEKRGQNLGAMMPETQNYVNKIMANANGGEMNPLLNSLNAFGAVGDLRSQQVPPEILAQIQQDKNLKASMLPLALGASMSGDSGVQNMANVMLPQALQGINPKQLKYGQILDDGTYITDVDSGADAAMMKAAMGGNQGKAPTGSMLQDANESIGMLNILNNLQGRFKDNYVSATPFDTVGKLENLVGRTVGMGLQDQGSWWSDYSQFLNDLRNSKFGATLTKGELQAFAEEATSPGKSAADVKHTIARQIQVLQNKLMEQAQMGQDSGYNMHGVSNALNRSMNRSGQVTNAPSTATGRGTDLTDEDILKQYGLR